MEVVFNGYCNNITAIILFIEMNFPQLCTFYKKSNLIKQKVCSTTFSLRARLLLVAFCSACSVVLLVLKTTDKNFRIEWGMFA